MGDARLPTEAEWEKVAKWNPVTDQSSAFPWGSEEPEFDIVNFNSDDTTEVGKFPESVSGVGAYDMAGNVHEWINDFYSATYYKNRPNTIRQDLCHQILAMSLEEVLGVQKIPLNFGHL